MSTQITTTANKTKAFAAMLNAESVQAQFKNALSEHKDAFVASLIDLYSGDTALQTCDTKLVIFEALKAATLKLPINKALGFSYIVVFKNNKKIYNEQTKREEWVKVPTPTFIPGYRGYIQLAMRTGQYKTLNADMVYEGEISKVNKLNGEITFDGEKKNDKVVGYFCYFELLNGFSKVLYMTVEEMAKYAKKYSPSIPHATSVDQLIERAQKDVVDKQVGWMGDFNNMALKTVVRRLLSKYGYLSVEMQSALANDTEDKAQDARNLIVQDSIEHSTTVQEDADYEELSPSTADNEKQLTDTQQDKTPQTTETDPY